MRTVTTKHLEPIRLFDWREEHLTRSPLNIKLLLNLLRNYLGNDDSDAASSSNTTVVGKKRAGPESYWNSPRKKKKPTSPGDRSEDESEKRLSLESELVPAFCHVYEFRYLKSTPIDDEMAGLVDDDATTTTEKLAQEEEELMTVLDQCRSPSEIKSFDLGEVSTAVGGSHVWVFHGKYSPEDTLLVLPSVPDKGCNFRADVCSSDVSQLDNVMYSCHRLQSARIIDISSRLRLDCSSLEDPISQDQLPFRIFVQVAVSLICPAVFEGVPKDLKVISSVEQHQLRVLSYIFPSPHPTPTNYRGDTDIPFLYSVLRKAPDLPSKAVEEAIQPVALLPTLLPFQRRSVAWMLKREGKIIDEQGRISSIVQSEVPLFWEEVQLDGRTFYLHRLKGTLSAVLPQVRMQFGGSLNEPPGLGKTVECIALILLNPDTGRNPSLKRWDTESKVFVKQVKTTLIVTPLALAPQWVDELKRHSPSLKVFVYEGWMKFNGPITEEDVEDIRQKRRANAIKGKRRTSRTSKLTKTAPPIRRNNGRKAKGDSEDYMDVDSDIENQAYHITDGEEGHLLDWCSYIQSFDVCICTYPVLQQDLGVARPPPIRPRRQIASYTNVERPRSPLVMCEWYRVIMDEVQMAGGGKTEEMVSLIPRISSFAVSGTPARSQISDLIHVLNFLRVKEVTGSSVLWKCLLKPDFVHQFVSLFDRYAIRTSKDSVQHELTIPTQTRFLVPIELGRVERHVYNQNVETALLELGYDARGVAAVDGWQVDSSLLRTWLRKLRGICTHPQVGQLQYQGDKTQKHGVLKSISEVLEGMRDQNWRNFMDERKIRVQALTRYAQLQQLDESDRVRYQHCLETLLLAETEADQLIYDVNAVITEHDVKGALLKKEAAVLRDSRNPTANQLVLPFKTVVADKGKGKAREQEPMEDSTSIDDSRLDDLPRTPAGEEHAIKRRVLQLRLRECHLVLHKVLFLKGDVYHVLGKNHSKDEDISYTKAEELRRKLLKSTEQSAMDAMDLIVHVTDKLSKEELLLPVPYLTQGGVRSADLIDEANELIGEVLNEQANLVWTWRTRFIALLTQSLSADAGEADGQEYSRTLETQGEAETFLQAYSALLADRREVLLAERTLLAAHDTREKNKRTTKTSKMAIDEPFDTGVMASITEDIELRPEHQVLQKDMASERKDLLFRSKGRAIKSVMVDLNGVVVRITNDKDPEKILVREAVSALRQLITSQAKLAEKLEADLAHFRRAFNERVLYFRQLQEISDSVSDVEFEGSLANAIKDAQVMQNSLEGKINTLRARQRYLDNLSQSQATSSTMEEDEACCILCRSEFKTGYVTQCAHVFCEDCLKAWLARKEGKVCPVCRVIIDTNQLQRFFVKSDKEDPVSAPPRVVNDELIPKSRRKIEYNMIDDELFKTINSVESSGSYGSKIQMLVRHLLYLQMTEPDAKSIVFSAWADSLHIIEHALHLNGIPCLRIDQKKNKQSAAKVFQDDPDIRVLLLHGERENAGLNIVCASRVFFVESVVNHAFEIQAIARIDRISQRSSTQVYCYYAEDTVEKNILDLAARQGLSLYTKENSAGTLNVSDFTLDSKKSLVDSTTKSKKGQKGDFIFKTDDMLAILFPHMYEDIEYLVPDEDVVMDYPLQTSGIAPSTRAEHINAEAGPSRSGC